ncbi:MAG TPA: galactosyldiacylglycerol synthase [Dehalococcoidia bacterium]|nr:galactosyldiacylglycerol synthase [Dehalococcoidia bacterium]
MIHLREKGSGNEIGAITEEQLRFLVDQLEEEYEEDRDYYIQREVLDMLEAAGGDADLIAMLARAMGDREGIEIEYTRD